MKSRKVMAMPVGSSPHCLSTPSPAEAKGHVRMHAGQFQAAQPMVKRLNRGHGRASWQVLVQQGRAGTQGWVLKAAFVQSVRWLETQDSDSPELSSAATAATKPSIARRPANANGRMRLASVPCYHGRP